MADIDYLTCKNCESPCYVFELDAREHVANAFCQMCGNDDVSEFRKPDDDDAEPDEEDLGPRSHTGSGGGESG